MIEFSLVFVPLMFMILGSFEIGRAMWTYHSLVSAVKRATRFAIVKGARCGEASAACQTSLGDIGERIRVEGLGLDPDELEITFVSDSHSISCAPLSSCLTSTTTWPASPDNAVGLPLTVQGRYPFRSFVFSLWPGQSRASFQFVADSTEVIQF